jgi:hypothetical protein
MTPPGFQAADGFGKGIHVAAGDADAVNAFSVGAGQDLLGNGAFLVADEFIGAVGRSDFTAYFPRTDGQNPAGPAQGAATDCHQADRADADDEHRIAELHVRQLHGVESRRHHIRKNAGINRIDAFGQVRQVAVRVVDMEKVSEDTVFKVGELPAAQHPSGMLLPAGLCGLGIPIRRNGRDQNLVARFEVLHQGPDLDDFGAAFVTEDHVVAVAQGTFPEGVHVGRTDCHGEGLTDGVQRTARRAILFNPARRSDVKHCITFHKDTSNVFGLFD